MWTYHWLLIWLIFVVSFNLVFILITFPGETSTAICALWSKIRIKFSVTPWTKVTDGAAIVLFTELKNLISIFLSDLYSRIRLMWSRFMLSFGLCDHNGQVPKTLVSFLNKGKIFVYCYHLVNVIGLGLFQSDDIKRCLL